MSQPWILDLFCGAGGASMGYYRAGFEVVGVDNQPQPDYPFDFIQADALDVLDNLSSYGDFWAIHASPPCQHYSRATARIRKQASRLPFPVSPYADLIPVVRQKLIRTQLPYIIENVMGAPLNQAIKLCGSMFNLPIQRHRLFEGSADALPDYHTLPKCNHKQQPAKVSVYGHSGFRPGSTSSTGDNSASTWRSAMDISWMDAASLSSQSSNPSRLHTVPWITSAPHSQHDPSL